MYISRAGFWLATDAPAKTTDAISRYYAFVTQPWFTGQSERENRAGAVRWFYASTPSAVEPHSTITASVPVYHDRYWYGVIALEFTQQPCGVC